MLGPTCGGWKRRHPWLCSRPHLGSHDVSAHFPSRSIFQKRGRSPPFRATTLLLPPLSDRRELERRLEFSFLAAQRTFNFFPDYANEVNAIPHLLSQRGRVGTEVFCLPQSEGRDAAGILQTPILRWLGVTRRCHMFAYLVEVVGLSRGGSHVQLFDVFGPDVNDLIDIL